MVDRPPGTNKQFPDINAYPQVPSTYQVIEPYVDFAADLESDRVRSKVTYSDVRRSKTVNVPPRLGTRNIRVKSLVVPKPSGQSPRHIKTAPYKQTSLTTGHVQCKNQAKIRDSLHILEKQTPVLYTSHVQDPKSPFDKAVESLAAMKLHDYALKRKERMRNRYRVCARCRTACFVFVSVSCSLWSYVSSCGMRSGVLSGSWRSQEPSKPCWSSKRC